MRKLRKLVRTPGIFFRDYFNKQYPVVNNEQLCPELEEAAVMQHLQRMEKSGLTYQESFPIDVVYTWINKNASWDREYQVERTKANALKLGQYALDPARFEDHNELFYSIRSLKKFIPWVRTIFVVTNNKIDLPNYLLEEEIRVVTHAELIDAEYLPTFNSHVIEAHLHKINGLSENFIYFNDDVFVARELSSTHFFQENGLASLFLAQKYLDVMYQKGTHTPTLLASLYSQSLLERECNLVVNQTLVHTYVPLKKSMYEAAWSLYKKEIAGFLGNKFRGNRDLNLATFLVPWLMYIEGKSSIASEICYYFNVRSPHANQQFKKLLDKPLLNRPHSICANDFHVKDSQKTQDQYQEKFANFLKKYFK